MTKYRLYRTLTEIFNPTISRQNISNYQIIMGNNFLPIEVYYPYKEVPIDNVLIYLNSHKRHFSQKLAEATNQLVFTININSKIDFVKCYNLILHIYNNIEKCNIQKDNITIMSDRKNNDILEKIHTSAIENDDFSIAKLITETDTQTPIIIKNQLNIPDIRNNYCFYNQEQLFTIINSFLYKN